MGPAGLWDFSGLEALLRLFVFVEEAFYLPVMETDCFALTRP
jgi:hypothetical protein